MSSTLSESSTDRGQLTGTPIPVVFGVVILVGILVFNEVQSQLAAAEGDVKTCEDLVAGCGAYGLMEPLVVVMLVTLVIGVVFRFRRSGEADE